MPNLSASAPDQDPCILDLETKLADMVELLHMWKGEAFPYRQLVEAVATKRVSIEEAKRLIDLPSAVWELPLRSCSGQTPVVVNLSPEEHDAFVGAANAAGLRVEEFLWACVASMMNSVDDENVLRGCREAVDLWFEEKRMSE